VSWRPCFKTRVGVWTFLTRVPCHMSNSINSYSVMRNNRITKLTQSIVHYMWFINLQKFFLHYVLKVLRDENNSPALRQILLFIILKMDKNTYQFHIELTAINGPIVLINVHAPINMAAILYYETCMSKINCLLLHNDLSFRKSEIYILFENM